MLELGAETREAALPAWRAAFEERVGPLSRVGTVMAAEAAWFDTWAVREAALLDGLTPLEALARGGFIDAELRRCSITCWWARGAELPLRATPARSEGECWLHGHLEAFGELRPGALVVGCTAEVAPTHHLLIGRPVVVDEDAVDDVLGLLASAPEEALLAALRWPEHRECTAIGEQVRQHFRRYALDDADSTVGLLRANAAFVESTALTFYEDDVCFEVLGQPFGALTPPPEEPGVVWELCREDRRDPPQIGEITVSAADGELSLSAPSGRRMEELVAALPARVRRTMGALRSEDLDLPDTLPRVRRDLFAPPAQ